MNNLKFLNSMLKLLVQNGIDTWLFGGWAEELQGLIQPRRHKDVDLLYFGKNFKQVDNFLDSKRYEIQIVKKFVHKRAFLINKVLVEIILVTKSKNEFTTDYFNSFLLTWPKNIFENSVIKNNIRMVNPQILRFYRENHKKVEGAYNSSLH